MFEPHLRPSEFMPLESPLGDEEVVAGSSRHQRDLAQEYRLALRIRDERFIGTLVQERQQFLISPQSLTS